MIRFILLNLRGLRRISPPEMIAEEVTHSEGMIHLPNLRYLMRGTNPDDLPDYPATDAALAPMCSWTPRSEGASLTVSQTVGGLDTAIRTTGALSSAVSEVTFAASY